MNIARCSTPIHLLKDRYIIAAGGNLSLATGSREKLTNTCELFDIHKKQWNQICSMDKARANTSMAAISDRHIFVFQGLQASVNSSDKNCIEYMDIGTLDSKSIQMAKWISIVVRSSDFVRGDTRGCALLQSSNEILLFGGQKTQCFYMDVGFLS